jgi:hypothetical protein
LILTADTRNVEFPSIDQMTRPATGLSKRKSEMTPDKLISRLKIASLSFRGGFHSEPEDGVPVLISGAAPQTLVLVGNVGPEMWREFSSSPEHGDAQPDPLDRWTQRMLNDLVLDLSEYGAIEPLYPFGGPPFLPFQRWAQRAEPVYPSPTGPLIHPVFGLWHAYRGALAFSEKLDLKPEALHPSPCDTCLDRACLKSCPVNAFDGHSYDVPKCTSFLVAEDAGQDCVKMGCLARRSCPVGKDYTYDPAQAEFHTAAFLSAQRPQDS